MPNQYTSEKKTLGELLSMTSPHIAVPDYQRDYSWDTSVIETFWQDLTDFSDDYPDDNIQLQEYFLGSIVLVNVGARHDLLDGQQRLATATILLSVLRDAMAEYSQDAATRTSQKYITEYDDATGTDAYKLTMSVYDRDFFRREIQEPRTGDYAQPAAELGSHRNIRRAREFFASQVQLKYDELGDGKRAFDWSLRIRKVLTDHVSVVVVASDDEDNAAEVFETLNDRGIGLSTPDLLRNLVLRRAPDTAREEIVACWKSVLEVGEDASVNDFLRHDWLSHRGDVKARAL
ncbi:MAG: DUF262 domain-containing protein, partial [Chloroflexi bacterium]|nr:DUF262 domain-containing protein [Chloroflexota bacterium]